MINVNIENWSLKEFLFDGFLLEHDKNKLTIRNRIGKPLAEIFYVEETNRLIIVSGTSYVWCMKITDIISVESDMVVIMYAFMENNNIRYGNMSIANY